MCTYMDTEWIEPLRKAHTEPSVSCSYFFSRNGLCKHPTIYCWVLPYDWLIQVIHQYKNGNSPGVCSKIQGHVYKECKLNPHFIATSITIPVAFY